MELKAHHSTVNTIHSTHGEAKMFIMMLNSIVSNHPIFTVFEVRQSHISRSRLAC